MKMHIQKRVVGNEVLSRSVSSPFPGELGRQGGAQPGVSTDGEKCLLVLFVWTSAPSSTTHVGHLFVSYNNALRESRGTGLGPVGTEPVWLDMRSRSHLGHRGSLAFPGGPGTAQCCVCLWNWHWDGATCAYPSAVGRGPQPACPGDSPGGRAASSWHLLFSFAGPTTPLIAALIPSRAGEPVGLHGPHSPMGVPAGCLSVFN